jgi:hypothetical protein
MTMKPCWRCSILLAAIGLASGVHAADDVAEQLAVILHVGPNGAGSAAAKQARDRLAQRDLEILPQLLAAMDTSNVIAANWLRTVYDPLVEKALADPQTKWPQDFLKEYVSDAKRRGRPRELALAILDKLEPKYLTEWLPTRLDDPDFRFEAIAIALSAGDKALAEQKTDQAKVEFRKAFTHARDSGQVSQAATKLQALGEPADVAKQLGLIVDWKLIGPFDAPKKTGFATVFPPEEKLDFNAAYPGQTGTDIRWMPYQTKDILGQVNLIEALGVCREAVGYAYAEIDAAEAGPAQLRCSADDNCTVWLNGKKVFGRDQWLNGTRFDRFMTPIALEKGRNTLLVKICQGPQHRDPEVPNNWTFQVRLCDAQGRGVALERR